MRSDGGHPYHKKLIIFYALLDSHQKHDSENDTIFWFSLYSTFLLHYIIVMIIHCTSIASCVPIVTLLKYIYK
jgi:hypothetical protein